MQEGEVKKENTRIPSSRETKPSHMSSTGPALELTELLARVKLEDSKSIPSEAQARSPQVYPLHQSSISLNPLHDFRAWVQAQTPTHQSTSGCHTPTALSSSQTYAPNHTPVQFPSTTAKHLATPPRGIVIAPREGQSSPATLQLFASSEKPFLSQRCFTPLNGEETTMGTPSYYSGAPAPCGIHHLSGSPQPILAADRSPQFAAPRAPSAVSQATVMHLPGSTAPRNLSSLHGQAPSFHPTNTLLFQEPSPNHTPIRQMGYNQHYGQHAPPPSLQFCSNPGPSPSPLGRNFSVESFRGSVVSAAKDQSGCRTLQKVLETFPHDSAEVQMVLAELMPSVPELMADPYGNFLIQKLLETSTDALRIAITTSVSPYLAHIATTPHGTFAVQKLVESLRTPEEEEIVCEGLKRDVSLLMTDVNGGHVIAKILQALSNPRKQFLYDGICSDIVAISNHKQGTCTVQKCFDCADLGQYCLLQDAVLANLTLIATDPFGNYVVSKMLERGRTFDPSGHKLQLAARCARVLAGSPHIEQLCTNKFCSNVVQRILTSHQPAAVLTLVEALVSDPCILQKVVLHGYGNYVAQTLLQTCPLPQLCSVVDAIVQIFPLISQQNYGKRVETNVAEAVRRLQAAGLSTSMTLPSVIVSLLQHSQGMAQPGSHQQRVYSDADWGTPSKLQ